MIKLSSQNVLFSGLQLKHNYRNSEGEKNAMEVEGSDTERAVPLVNTELCFIITSKFAKEVHAPTKQCFDDLNVALDNLEKERLQGYLCEILPLLELYLLRQQGEDDSSRKDAISIDKQVGKYKYQMKKKSGFSTKESESPYDVRDMALRAVKLLGKLGTDESWLADAAAKQAY